MVDVDVAVYSTLQVGLQAKGMVDVDVAVYSTRQLYVTLGVWALPCLGTTGTGAKGTSDCTVKPLITSDCTVKPPITSDCTVKPPITSGCTVKPPITSEIDFIERTAWIKILNGRRHTCSTTCVWMGCLYLGGVLLFGWDPFISVGCFYVRKVKHMRIQCAYVH